jgi:hypothetical protein
MIFLFFYHGISVPGGTWLKNSKEDLEKCRFGVQTDFGIHIKGTAVSNLMFVVLKILLLSKEKSEEGLLTICW